MLCDITNKLSISKLHHGNCYYSDKQLSNHRADFDEIDVDDAMLGEVDFQLDEESPERDLGRQSLGAETVQELAPKIASRKRGSSRPDFAHRTKRSQTSSSHHSHYLHAHEAAPRLRSVSRRVQHSEVHVALRTRRREAHLLKAALAGGPDVALSQQVAALLQLAKQERERRPMPQPP